jgi:hypothetical protein
MRRFAGFVLMTAGIAVSAFGQDISPLLFGQNHWMDRSDEGRRPGYIYMLWPKVEESGIKAVRIGGGGYNRRLPKPEKLTAIIDSIQGIGAEPVLQVPSHYSAEEAAKLVRFLNKSNRKPVRYWSIGNEPLLRDRDGIQKVYDYVKRLAPAMKAADPSIQIFIFDECSLFEGPHQRVVGGDLDLTGKDENGNWMVDGITFHRYPNISLDFDREDVVFAGVHDVRGQVMQLIDMMETANRKNGRTGAAKLKWGLTEVNVSTSNPDREISGYGNTSFLGGQFMAEIYGLGMEFGAFTVAPWCISETDRVSTDFGYLGLPSEFYPRSSYYHTQMMALNMKGEFLPTQSSNSFVKTIGSRSDDEICVMILNKDEVHDFDFDIFLKKAGDSGKPLMVHADAGLDVTISGRIPNQTTMMVVLSKSGEIRKQYTYGLTHNLKYQAPEEVIFRKVSVPKGKNENADSVVQVLKRDGVIPPRDPKTPKNSINLSDYYTASLDDDWLVSAGANLQPLPKGIQTFAGVKFDVRGLIQLAGKNLYMHSELDDDRKKEYYPEAVKNIKVRLKGQKIHFLHSSSWGADEGEKVGTYVIHYENGEIREIPILYLRSLRDWWTAPKDPVPQNAEIAWKGRNEPAKKAGCDICIFKYTWVNPLPDVKITAIDFMSSMTTASPYLIAFTME